MKVGLLVCGAFSDEIMSKYKGAYEDFFVRGLGSAEPSLTFQVYHVFKDEFPNSYQECDAWLITGSRDGVYENFLWMQKLQILIREIYRAEIPLVGICFGHQILAAALGGSVEKSSQGWGLGLQHYELLECQSALQVDKLDLLAIHQDQIVVCPPQARVFLRTDHCPNAGLIYKGQALSFQPHPEFSKEFEQDLIKSIMGVRFSVEEGQRALASLSDACVHNQEVMGLIAAFMMGQSEIMF